MYDTPTRSHANDGVMPVPLRVNFEMAHTAVQYTSAYKYTTSRAMACGCEVGERPEQRCGARRPPPPAPPRPSQPASPRQRRAHLSTLRADAALHHRDHFQPTLTSTVQCSTVLRVLTVLYICLCKVVLRWLQTTGCGPKGRARTSRRRMRRIRRSMSASRLVALARRRSSCARGAPRWAPQH